MPPLFTRLLADRLNSRSRLKVQEGQEGKKVESGQVWIAPGDRHMTVARKGSDVVLALKRDPPENSCRPAVDVLFRSVANAYGANALAVVLTGMGADGTLGARVIRDAGGEVIVQDEASSVVWGMPGSVVAASLADRICPLANIAAEVVRRVTFPRMRVNAAAARRMSRRDCAAHQEESALSGEAQDAFGSPPPELPNHVLILCPIGQTVNVTSVMS